MKGNTEKASILVADDNISLCKIMSFVLGHKGYLAIRKVNPEAVAIMMTAYRQEVAELVEEAFNNHAYTCLYKPLDMAEVLQLVGEIWERKR